MFNQFGNNRNPSNNSSNFFPGQNNNPGFGFGQPPNSNPANFFNNPSQFINSFVNMATESVPVFNSFFEADEAHRNERMDQEQAIPTYTNTRSGFYKGKTEEEEQARKMKKSVSQKDIVVLNENMGEYWKQKGNDEFLQKDYSQAIQMYSEAIQRNPSVGIYYSNRAKCHQYLKHLDQAYQDAVESIELDEKNVFGHLILGQLLAESGKYEKDTKKIENAISKISKALRLCSGQGKTKHEQDISVYLFRAKKLLWLKIQQINMQKQKEILDNYLENMKKLKYQEEEIAEQMNKFKLAFGDSLQISELVIPEYLICNITFDLIEDPVTTSAGFTYEQAVIEEHIKQNGPTDPMNRQPITDQLIPNLAVKKGIEEFLKNNPWAFQYSPDQHYYSIEF